MAGQSIPIISKRAYDFANGSASFVVAKAIPVVMWTQGALLVRVHAKSFGSGSKIEVIAKVTAPTGEEPSVDFVDVGAAIATATVDAGNAVGDLERVALSADFGGFLQITVSGTLATGPCSATISAELVLKD